MAKILLTGATGFVGRNLLQGMVQNGDQVIAPVRRNLENDEIFAAEKVRRVEGAFFDSEVLKECQMFHPEVIVHSAAIRGEGKGNWEDYRQVNVEGTQRLVEFALQNKVQLFIYLSSVGVFGTIPREVPAKVSTPVFPDGFYHRSKWEGEQIVAQNLTGKIPYLILRPTIIYGKGDNGFLPRLIGMVRKRIFPLSRKPIQIHLVNIRFLVDLVVHFIREVEVRSGVWIVADRSPVRLDQLVNLIHRHYHGTPYPFWLRLPSLVFRTGESIFHLLGMGGLEISLKLISHSWYYDVQPLQQLDLVPLTETLSGVQTLLKELEQ